MQLIALQRWHWIVISLLVGLIVGAARQSFQGEIYGDYIGGFGYQLTDQLRFEKAVVDEFQGAKRFKNITVYPRWILDNHGSRKLVYVVSGLYWSGKSEIVNGAAIATFHPTCFIAQIPYVPRIDLSAYNKPGGPDLAARFRVSARQNTVCDFLDVLQVSANVNYSYAWWDARPILSATLASLLVIGGLWPTAINLMAFGSLTRPPQARGISLWNYRGTAPPKPVIADPAPPRSKLTDLEREIEAALMNHAAVSETARETSRALSSLPLEPIAPIASGPEKEFGADKEDFYPTERHKPARSESQHRT